MLTEAQRRDILARLKELEYQEKTLKAYMQVAYGRMVPEEVRQIFNHYFDANGLISELGALKNRYLQLLSQ